MQASIDAAREARKPTESSRLAKAAALVAGITLAILAGAAIAAGQPQGQMTSDLATRRRGGRQLRIPELDGDTLVLATDRSAQPQGRPHHLAPGDAEPLNMPRTRSSAMYAIPAITVSIRPRSHASSWPF
jgi:hypothetical protein